MCFEVLVLKRERKHLRLTMTKRFRGLLTEFKNSWLPLFVADPESPFVRTVYCTKCLKMKNENNIASRESIRNANNNNHGIMDQLSHKS